MNNAPVEIVDRGETQSQPGEPIIHTPSLHENEALAHWIGEECRQFCQDFSVFNQKKSHFINEMNEMQQLVKIHPQRFDNAIESFSSMPQVFKDFHQASATVDNCRTLYVAWCKSSLQCEPLKAAYLSVLILCDGQFKRAALSFANYYHALGPEVQEILMRDSDWFVEQVFKSVNLDKPQGRGNTPATMK